MHGRVRLHPVIAFARKGVLSFFSAPPCACCRPRRSQPALALMIPLRSPDAFLFLALVMVSAPRIQALNRIAIMNSPSITPIDPRLVLSKAMLKRAARRLAQRLPQRPAAPMTFTQAYEELALLLGFENYEHLRRALENIPAPQPTPATSDSCASIIDDLMLARCYPQRSGPMLEVVETGVPNSADEVVQANGARGRVMFTWPNDTLVSRDLQTFMAHHTQGTLLHAGVTASGKTTGMRLEAQLHAKAGRKLALLDPQRVPLLEENDPFLVQYAHSIDAEEEFHFARRFEHLMIEEGHGLKGFLEPSASLQRCPISTTLHASSMGGAVMLFVNSWARAQGHPFCFDEHVGQALDHLYGVVFYTTSVTGQRQRHYLGNAQLKTLETIPREFWTDHLIGESLYSVG